MGTSATFGRRYNLTGADVYTEEGYVDTFARILERDVETGFIPAEMMDDIYAGRVAIQGGGMQSLVDTRARSDARVTARFQVGRLVQRLAPNLHHWNRQPPTHHWYRAHLIAVTSLQPSTACRAISACSSGAEA